MLVDIVSYMKNKLALIPVIGGELEFQILGIEDVDLGGLSTELALQLESLQCDILKESSKYQYELRIHHGMDIEKFIDTVTVAKEKVLEFVNRSGGTADFSAKPDINAAGNAFHVHVNLVDNAHCNVFSKSADGSMSTYLSYSIGGLCAYMKEHLVLFAPHAHSYLRYVHADIHTPTTISWGGNNRSAALRLPDTTLSPQNCRIEHRVPCSDCDYENAVSAILFGIIRGIENNILPPERTFGVASDSIYNLEKLPQNLEDAYKAYRPISL